jgi:hypothetical protein
VATHGKPLTIPNNNKCYRMKKTEKLFNESEIINKPCMKESFYFEQQAFSALKSSETLLINANRDQRPTNNLFIQNFKFFWDMYAHEHSWIQWW